MEELIKIMQNKAMFLMMKKLDKFLTCERKTRKDTLSEYRSKMWYGRPKYERTFSLMIQRIGILRIDLQDIGDAKTKDLRETLNHYRAEQEKSLHKCLDKIGLMTMREIYGNKAQALSKLYNTSSVQGKRLKSPLISVLYWEVAQKSRHPWT